MTTQKKRAYTKQPSSIPRLVDEFGNVFVAHSTYAKEHELYRDPKLKKEDRYMHEGLLKAFDSVRTQLDHALIITSGRRSQETQDYLREKNARAAKVSTHVYGVALDIHVPGYMSDENFAEIMRKAVRRHCGIVPRCGYVSYRERGAKSSTWVHIDVAPLIWRDELPQAWRREGIVW